MSVGGEREQESVCEEATELQITQESLKLALHLAEDDFELPIPLPSSPKYRDVPILYLPCKFHAPSCLVSVVLRV